MSVMSSRAKRATAGKIRGYTSVEVLIAMTLLAIGAAGVIGMQRVTIQGSEDARRFDMATNIANEWLSRLQKDASFWRTQPDRLLPDDMGFNSTVWLKNIDLCAAGLFCTIPMPTGSTVEGLSPAFDVFGRDVVDGQAYYCVQYRLTWIASPGTAPYTRPLRPSAIMRTDVRVWWNRLEKNPIGTCNTPPPEAIPANAPYHVVYASTALREGAPR